MNILITGAGGSVLTSILPQLKGINFNKVFLLDMNSEIAINQLCDNKKFIFIKCPSGLDVGYKDFIKKLIIKNNIECCIPLVDEEIRAFVELYLEGVVKKLCSPKNLKFVDICLDKYKLTEVLNNNNIPSPKLIDNLIDYKSEIIAKPKLGHGSKGIYYFRDGKETIKFMELNIIEKDKYVFQEVVKGVEYTISVIPLDDRNIIVPKRIIKKKGITIAAMTEKNHIIQNCCEDIIKKLDPKGPINIQLIMDKEMCIPKIFEINPRLSTTTILTYKSGINEVQLGLNLNYEDKKIEEFKTDLYMYRFYDQIFVRGEKVEKGCFNLWSQWIYGE